MNDMNALLSELKGILTELEDHCAITEKFEKLLKEELYEANSPLWKWTVIYDFGEERGISFLKNEVDLKRCLRKMNPDAIKIIISPISWYEPITTISCYYYE